MEMEIIVKKVFFLALAGVAHVVGTSYHIPKHYRFNYRSGHIPRL